MRMSLGLAFFRRQFEGATALPVRLLLLAQTNKAAG